MIGGKGSTATQMLDLTRFMASLVEQFIIIKYGRVRRFVMIYDVDDEI